MPMSNPAVLIPEDAKLPNAVSETLPGMEDAVTEAQETASRAGNRLDAAPQSALSVLSDKEAAKREKKEKKEREKREKREAKELEKASQRSHRVAEKAAEHVAASRAKAASAKANAAKTAEKEVEKQMRVQKQQEKRDFERAAAENHRDVTMYDRFCAYSFVELEQLLRGAETREERAFYRSLLNLKLQIEQEKVIGEVLL